LHCTMVARYECVSSIAGQCPSGYTPVGSNSTHCFSTAGQSSTTTTTGTATQTAAQPSQPASNCPSGTVAGQDGNCYSTGTGATHFPTQSDPVPYTSGQVQQINQGNQQVQQALQRCERNGQAATIDCPEGQTSGLPANH
jgi:hypothetical protein